MQRWKKLNTSQTPRIARIATRCQSPVKHLDSNIAFANQLARLAAYPPSFSPSSNKSDNLLAKWHSLARPKSTHLRDIIGSLRLQSWTASIVMRRRHKLSLNTKIEQDKSQRHITVLWRTMCSLARRGHQKNLPRCGYLKVQLHHHHHGCNPRCLWTCHQKNIALAPDHRFG
jgi:hypothetical protein